MWDVRLLSEAQMRRIEPLSPRSHVVSRVDDRRVISVIVFVLKNGLRWRDEPAVYGPYKTIYNWVIRWSRLGVFNRIFAELAAKGGTPDRLMIYVIHLKAHRTAASLIKKGGSSPMYRSDQRRTELEAARGHRRPRPASHNAAHRRPRQRLPRRSVAIQCPAASQGVDRRQGL
jgi:putative transposase